LGKEPGCISWPVGYCHSALPFGRCRALSAGLLQLGIIGWFTEGFDMPDLKEAKTLLDTLA
jgi:hypothetical protein